MRVAFSLTGIVVVLAASTIAFADARDVTLQPSRREATTDGVVDVFATPAEIYASVTDYGAWPRLFSDVASVRVRNADRERGELEFKSRALGHTVTIRFSNVAKRMIRFTLVDGPPGARSTGEYRLEPLGNGATRIRASLYMDVVGATGWLMTDGQIRRRREGKLRADLGDLLKRFPRRESR